MKDTYLEEGEKEAKKCNNYEDNCYCNSGYTCYVFGDKINKSEECEGFEPLQKQNKDE